MVATTLAVTHPRYAEWLVSAICHESPMNVIEICIDKVKGQYGHLDVEFNRQTLLQTAVAWNRVDVAREMLKEGANPNVSGALCAALAHHKRLLPLFLTHPALDVDFCLLQVCKLLSGEERLRTVVLLLGRGADPDYEHFGHSATRHAAKTGDKALIKLLLLKRRKNTVIY